MSSNNAWVRNEVPCARVVVQDRHRWAVAAVRRNWGQSDQPVSGQLVAGNRPAAGNGPSDGVICPSPRTPRGRETTSREGGTHAHPHPGMTAHEAADHRGERFDGGGRHRVVVGPASPQFLHRVDAGPRPLHAAHRRASGARSAQAPSVSTTRSPMRWNRVALRSCSSDRAVYDSAGCCGTYGAEAARFKPPWSMMARKWSSCRMSVGGPDLLHPNQERDADP